MVKIKILGTLLTNKEGEEIYFPVALFKRLTNRLWNCGNYPIPRRLR